MTVKLHLLLDVHIDISTQATLYPELQLADDVYYLVGTMHSKLHAICRIIAHDPELLALARQRFEGLDLSHGTMCSGCNGIKKSK